MIPAARLHLFGLAALADVSAATTASAGIVKLGNQAERFLGTDTSKVPPLSGIRDQWESQFDWDFLRNAAVSNSSGGGAALTTGGLHYSQNGTSATAGSFSAWSAAFPLLYKGLASQSINWAKPWAALVGVQSTNITANGILRFMLGGRNAFLSSFLGMNISGIGFDVRNRRLWAIFHNGITFTQYDTGFDLTAATPTGVFIYSDGAGNFSIFTDGVQRGVTQTGAPSAVSSGNTAMNLLHTNGGDAAVFSYNVSSPIKILIGQ